jgi:type IV secretion system protein VirB11
MTQTPETRARHREMLRTAFGPAIAAALGDPETLEIMVNPDGRLWLDLMGKGKVATDHQLRTEDVERIILLIASHLRLEIHHGNPILSGELPDGGERFEGLVPPVVTAPCFSIRKPAGRIHRLEDYVADGILSPLQAGFLRHAVADRRNILIAGGTSSGKTTLANALLAELGERDERVILIEDTRELQCAAPDSVALRSQAGIVTLSDLVRATLRLRPDRIIIGEVRGGEALDLLKAWNTGHPGGIATIHANGPRAALYRLEQLVQEAVQHIPRRLIADANDLILFISGRGLDRRLQSICQVNGLGIEGDYAVTELRAAQLHNP